MLRCLLWAAGVLLTVAPAGVGVGVSLAVSAGWGVAAASVLYGAVAVWMLSADLIPAPAAEPREAVR